MWSQVASMIPFQGWALLIVYLRVQACVIALPGLGESVLPLRVRVAAAMALTPLLAEGIPPGASPEDLAGGLALAASELVIGLAAGMLIRLLALALDMATTAIAATASLSQLVGVQNEAAPHPIGNLLHLGGIAILMALGLPVMLANLLADSFLLWPAGSLPDIDRLAPAAVQVLADSFLLAMMIAAPFTLGGLLFQALSGVISRVMPSLPVVFIGSPGAILLALVALAVLAPMLIEIWADAVLQFTLPRPG